MSNCSNCGTPLMQGSKYCHNCGNIVRDINSPMPVMPGKEAPDNINYTHNNQGKKQIKFTNKASETRRKNLRRNWLLIILLSAAIIAVYIIIEVLTNN
jgi:uncharacterized membrane protein YvbJ